MLTARQCRARALKSQRSATATSDSTAKAHYETVAREWRIIADMAEGQESLELALGTRKSPN
jgi:hypothetical protein